MIGLPSTDTAGSIHINLHAKMVQLPFVMFLLIIIYPLYLYLYYLYLFILLIIYEISKSLVWPSVVVNKVSGCDTVDPSSKLATGVRHI